MKYQKLDTQVCLYMTHACPIQQLPRDLGILLARAVANHKEHVASQQPYVDVRCSAEKEHNLPDEEMTVTRGYQPVQCSGHCLLYPAETPNVTAKL